MIRTVVFKGLKSNRKPYLQAISFKVYKELPGGSGIILFSFQPIQIKKGLFEFFVCVIRFQVTKPNKTREFNLFHGSIFSSDRKS